MSIEETKGKGTYQSKKTGFRNFPMGPKVIYGKGSFSQLADILMPQRRNSNAPFIFLVDAYFEDKDIAFQIPWLFNDQIIFVDTKEEPKTSQVDALVQMLKGKFDESPSGIVGIGGGSMLDLAKAVAIVYNQKKEAKNYQGWDLVPKEGLFHLGIPTISGTGAEVSRTAVLSGPERKLGINSDFTPFDQVLLDPDLTHSVPHEQWFYTGMDCFIHSVESLTGTFINAFSQSYGRMAFDLCKEVYLTKGNDSLKSEQLMMASWHGGMSIAYSQVGVAHALSYGLSHVLGLKHGLGNCLVFQHLEDYYPDGVKIFNEMMDNQEIELPIGLMKNVSEEELDHMADVAIDMEPLWENALGSAWRSKIKKEDIINIYQKI